MAKRNTDTLREGFSQAGTFLFSQKADAEGVAAMLGLAGAFQMQTDEGMYWMPGKSFDELMDRIYSPWTVPDHATPPKATPQTQTLMKFQAFLERT